MSKLPPESSLLLPVLNLFSQNEFDYGVEVPHGGRKIDVLLRPKNMHNDWYAIELKVKNWKEALWQARVNFQLAEKSYIALWKDYAHLPFKKEKILKAYGVGLIEVGENYAKVLLQSSDNTFRRGRTKTRKNIVLRSK